MFYDEKCFMIWNITEVKLLKLFFSNKLIEYHNTLVNKVIKVYSWKNNIFVKKVLE